MRVYISSGMVFVLLSVSFFFVASNVEAQSLTVERVASGLDDPLFVTYAPGIASRLYIVQRGGAIRVLNLSTGILNAANFMVVPEVSTSGTERGLLGLAFHPDYQTNRLFYVSYTDTSGGDTRIVQFTATNANVADPGTAVNILEIDQPQGTHNGGWIGFGNDGYLYFASGDGGGSNDDGNGHVEPDGNAQDITNNLLGKILRIDIDGDDFPGSANKNYAIPSTNPFVGIPGDDEIFAYGVRNPWRCSFDRLLGDLYVADVGQGRREEVTVLRSDDSIGQNLGWRLREGTTATPDAVGGPIPPGAIDPIYDYRHGNGSFSGNSVTGGYVYRGPIAELQGNYFFADFVSSNIWSLRFDGSDANSFDGTNFTDLTRWTDVINSNAGTVNSISSFGEDLAGNLYILDFGGEVFKVTGGTLTTPIGSFGGNVNVEVRNGDLRVVGQNNTDQCIVVTATGVLGRYKFSSVDDGNSTSTTFNGQSSIVVNGVDDDMRFDLKSGRKVLILSKKNQQQFSVPDDLRINGTGSDSAIVILDSADISGRTDIKSRHGDDVILTSDCTFSERVRINVGRGNDIVVDGQFSAASFFAGDLDVRTGSGDDLVVCSTTMASAKVTARLGSGDDSVAFQDCSFGPLAVYGNGDFDRFAADNNFFESEVLRSVEDEFENVATVLNELGDDSMVQDALDFFLGLNNNE